jgi:hypothetical protein
VSVSSDTSSVGFAGLLGILFIGLKLGHVIYWSWWWVLAPLWIPVVLSVILLAIVGVVRAWR